MHSKEKVIILWGRGSIGKTTTLKMLRALLLAEGGIETQCHTVEGDVCSRISLHGKTVGFTSRGDDAQSLREDFDRLGDCALYICAARTKGSMWSVINEHAQKEEQFLRRKATVYAYHNELDGKALERLYEQVNTAQARELLAQTLCRLR